MIDVVMPKMGESITEGTILEWKKKVGDAIDKDETLLEISTDKVDSEIPSPASGIIVEITAQVNETVLVGEVIARISKDGDEDKPEKDEDIMSNDEPQPLLNKDESKSVDLPDEQTVSSQNSLDNEEAITLENKSTIQAFKRFYSPLVKSISLKENITQEELDSITGSGRDGRVNKQDLLSFLNTRSSPSHMSTTEKFTESDSILMQDKVEPMSRMRKKIADHMVESVRTSPHVYTTVEADVTTLVDVCSKHKDDFKERAGVNLTFTPMILDGCIRTILEFPLMNASLDNDNIIYHQNINMGVAVALPDDNLIVPVIHASEEKNFLGLARSTADLSNRARENKLSPDEIFGSTFTVTNPGVFGGLFGMGIINQPNVGILAVGTFQKRPVVKETQYGDTIVVRRMVYLTLSYDHRIIDGAYGTRFLSRLVEQLENFSSERIKG